MDDSHDNTEGLTGDLKEALPQGIGIRIEVFGRTDVGLVRDHNEDNFLIADLSRKERSCKPEVQTHWLGSQGTLFAVCDGMGGAAAGEVASQMAVDTIYQTMESHGTPSKSEDVADWLEKGVEEASRRIFKTAREDRSKRGMGTTLTAAILVDQRLYIAQVGDSRAYIIRTGKLVQVSKDQSLVSQLIDAGHLTKEEAANFEHHNIILQALGTSELLQVDMTYVDLCADDKLILCSDGLHGMISDDQILQVVNEHAEPKEICRILTDLACDSGGMDNITVIFAKFSGPALLQPSPEAELSYHKLHPPKPEEKPKKEGKRPSAAEVKVPVAAEEKKPAPETRKAEAPAPAPGPRKKPGAARPVFASMAVALVLVAAYFLLRGRGETGSAGPSIPASTPEIHETQAPALHGSSENAALPKAKSGFEPSLDPLVQPPPPETSPPVERKPSALQPEKPTPNPPPEPKAEPIKTEPIKTEPIAKKPAKAKWVEENPY